jgi:hypothetical protein
MTLHDTASGRWNTVQYVSHKACQFLCAHLGPPAARPPPPRLPSHNTQGGEVTWGLVRI